MSKHALLGCILSIIPGLAHYVDGRFREVNWFVLVWFLSLTAGIFIYGSNPGLLLLGLAVGIHSWIAYSYALSKELAEPSGKIRTFIVMLFVLGVIYAGIRNTVFKGFVFGYTNMTIPYQNIKAGDLLLARRGLTQAAKLNRGDIVLAPVAGDIYGGYGHHGQALRQGPIMASEIVGLAGEQVEIVNSSFVVDGKTLDAKKYPVPEWLRGHNIAPISVPDTSFFVSIVYNVNGHGMVLDAGLVGQACVVRSSDIEAKAVMRWFPLARRGFLRAGE
jgi:type IV secretory pathway protease TraF